MTIPRVTRCTRRVAPGRMSPAAHCRARQPSPAWGPLVAARRPVRSAGGSVLFTDGPFVPALASPSGLQLPLPASPSPAGRRAPGAPDIAVAAPLAQREHP